MYPPQRNVVELQNRPVRSRVNASEFSTTLLFERGAVLSESSVITLRERDSTLIEEAQHATRIVRAIRDGQIDAESEMVDRYSRGLGYLLARRVGDNERSLDLLQETFCIAIEKLRNIDLDNPERLAGYLRGIAVRVAMNAGRKRNREPHSIDIEAVAAIPDTEQRQFQQISTEQTQTTVRRLLDTLPVERDRDLLIRFYVYDQDKKEICRALGLDSLHFNRVLFRAKKRFRKILEESKDYDELVPPEDA